ncbi:MAG: hypothetical protein U9O24_09795 [Campylobacterota bacterium]|nr:hypothetical protein [Campylobacterota bacterium]
MLKAILLIVSILVVQSWATGFTHSVGYEKSDTQSLIVVKGSSDDEDDEHRPSAED